MKPKEKKLESLIGYIKKMKRKSKREKSKAN